MKDNRNSGNTGRNDTGDIIAGIGCAAVVLGIFISALLAFSALLGGFWRFIRGVSNVSRQNQYREALKLIRGEIEEIPYE